MRRFLAYLAIAAVGCSFAVGCDDNDEPTDPRINDPYNTIQYIEIDERSYDWIHNMIGGSTPLLFKKEGFKNYSTILTKKDGIYFYEVFIPASGGELNLTDSVSYNWFLTENYMFVDEEKKFLEEEQLGNEQLGNEPWYFFRKYNDYLSLSHTEPKKLDFTIFPNPSKSQRKLGIRIWEHLPANTHIRMIFIQAGK